MKNWKYAFCREGRTKKEAINKTNSEIVKRTTCQSSSRGARKAIESINQENHTTPNHPWPDLWGFVEDWYFRPNYLPVRHFSKRKTSGASFPDVQNGNACAMMSFANEHSNTLQSNPIQSNSNHPFRVPLFLHPPIGSSLRWNLGWKGGMGGFGVRIRWHIFVDRLLQSKSPFIFSNWINEKEIVSSACN